MKLGDKVTCTAVLGRMYEYRTNRNDRKYWLKRETKPRTGIYIGARTLANGERWFEDEVGYVFEAKEHFRAALVVFSTHENPVYVPLGALEPADV